MKSTLNFDNVNDKLELFRRVYNLGLTDIEKALADSWCLDHLTDKYKYYRDKDGFHGNFSFMFQLDCEHARMLMQYIGF